MPASNHQCLKNSQQGQDIKLHDFFSIFQSHQEEVSQIGYFIFVILSECEIHFRLPKSKRQSTYQIIFKPNLITKPNYGKLIFYMPGVAHGSCSNLLRPCYITITFEITV